MLYLAHKRGYIVLFIALPLTPEGNMWYTYSNTVILHTGGKEGYRCLFKVNDGKSDYLYPSNLKEKALYNPYLKIGE